MNTYRMQDIETQVRGIEKKRRKEVRETFAKWHALLRTSPGSQAIHRARREKFRAEQEAAS